MAFGIDDALLAATAGINLTDTVVRTVRAYRKRGVSIDIERLIEEVRITALQRIDEADAALLLFERTLLETGVDLDTSLNEIIKSTPIWQPFEEHRLKRLRQSFNALSDATYNATDDITALLRCRDQTGDMRKAVIESAKHKHNLHTRLSKARSVKESISFLRDELLRHKEALMCEVEVVPANWIDNLKEN